MRSAPAWCRCHTRTRGERQRPTSTADIDRSTGCRSCPGSPLRCPARHRRLTGCVSINVHDPTVHDGRAVGRMCCGHQQWSDVARAMDEPTLEPFAVQFGNC